MSDHSETIERMQDLTMKGELSWRPIYNDLDMQRFSERGPKDATRPDGYLLVDQTHGFGVATVTMRDENYEIYGEPHLFIRGEEIDASDVDIGILLDAIKAHLDEIRDGEKLSPKKQMQKKVEQQLEPYEQEIKSLRRELAMEESRSERLLSVVENLSAGHMPQPEDAPEDAEAAPEQLESGDSDDMTLDPDLFREALWHYVEDDLSRDEFEEAFSEARAAQALDYIRYTVE